MLAVTVIVSDRISACTFHFFESETYPYEASQTTENIVGLSSNWSLYATGGLLFGKILASQSTNIGLTGTVDLEVGLVGS